VHSIAWRTDLELRRLEGARLTDHADHIVVCAPENPSYRWGNFVLLASARETLDAQVCAARFAAAFPHADYVAVGLDSRPQERPAIAGLAGTGMIREVNAVLTAGALRAPASPPQEAELRRLQSEKDWREAVALRLSADEGSEGAGYREFLERHMRAVRRVCESGRGAWFGAFHGGEIVSGVGVFDAGRGVARFQAVDTHPAHRRLGLASNLLALAGEYAREHLGASTLVIVADPRYSAIRIYRSLGFREHGQQVQLERVR
jgi:ribosomal protein S18 acetylase RimI-like enzyme